MRAGDVVKHRQSGEEWVLARVHNGYVYPAGWPACRTLAGNCDLVEAATDEQHVQMLRDVQNISGYDCRKGQQDNAMLAAREEAEGEEK